MVATHPEAGNTTLQIAEQYLAAGISIIPIRCDGTKAPAVKKWEPYQHEPATLDEVQEWFSHGSRGIAGVCGKVSGNLEVIDFDDGELYEPWKELVDDEMPGLVAKLTRHRTPRPGMHVPYRCPVISGNTDLALKPVKDPKTGQMVRKAVIETRGEGGYFLLPGCPAACHTEGRLYEHVAGPPITAAVVITPEERDVFWRAAQSFDQWIEPTDIQDGPRRTAGDNGKLRPGDDFNLRGPGWAELLEPFGWVEVRPGHWRRPGKEGKAWSAKICTASDGAELFCVFSRNAHPFESDRPSGRLGRPYSKFAAYTVLNHGGDYTAAARALREQGYGEPTKTKSTDRTGKCDGEPQTPARKGPEVFTAHALMQMELPEPSWVVQGILPEGLCLLAGKPKLGKSWMGLNLAMAVATGGTALGTIQVEKGEVLYLALEDTKRRLKSRIEKLLKQQDTEAPKGLHLTRTWPRQDQGGLDELVLWLRRHENTRLVVIDTWQRWRPPKTRGGNDYEQDYLHAGQLKEVADRFGVSVLAVHHCRKGNSEDPLEEVSGTLGLTGAADGVLVLQRERGQHHATLFTTGRDIEEQDIAVAWDAEFALWSAIGKADEYRISKERQAIMDVLRAHGEPMTPSQVAPLVGKLPNTCKQMLWRMERENWVMSDGNGRYFASK